MLSLINAPSNKADFFFLIALFPQEETSLIPSTERVSFSKTSTVTLNVLLKIINFSVSGSAISASHLDIDCLLTLQISANSSCEYPSRLRSICIFSYSFI